MSHRIIPALASTLLIMSCDLFESDKSLNVIPGIEDSIAEVREFSSEPVQYSSAVFALESSQVKSAEAELPLKKESDSKKKESETKKAKEEKEKKEKAGKEDDSKGKDKSNEPESTLSSQEHIDGSSSSEVNTAPEEVSSNVGPSVNDGVVNSSADEIHGDTSSEVAPSVSSVDQEVIVQSSSSVAEEVVPVIEVESSFEAIVIDEVSSSKVVSEDVSLQESASSYDAVEGQSSLVMASSSSTIESAQSKIERVGEGFRVGRDAASKNAAQKKAKVTEKKDARIQKIKLKKAERETRTNVR